MKHAALFLAALTMPIAVSAGCIGPVIMGECQGQAVQWDTHPQGPSNTPPAAPGYYYDKRGTNAEQLNPGSVNQFTGRDAHDADMDASNRQRCYEQRARKAQLGLYMTCP